MAADESTRTPRETLHTPPRACGKSFASIERQHVERAVTRLQSNGTLDRGQREVVETLAADITSALAPAVIEALRVSRHGRNADGPVHPADHTGVDEHAEADESAILDEHTKADESTILDGNSNANGSSGDE